MGTGSQSSNQECVGVERERDLERTAFQFDNEAASSPTDLESNLVEELPSLTRSRGIVAK